MAVQGIVSCLQNLIKVLLIRVSGALQPCLRCDDSPEPVQAALLHTATELNIFLRGFTKLEEGGDPKT